MLKTHICKSPALQNCFIHVAGDLRRTTPVNDQHILAELLIESTSNSFPACPQQDYSPLLPFVSANYTPTVFCLFSALCSAVLVSNDADMPLHYFISQIPRQIVNTNTACLKSHLGNIRLVHVFMKIGSLSYHVKFHRTSS